MHASLCRQLVVFVVWGTVAVPMERSIVPSLGVGGSHCWVRGDSGNARRRMFACLELWHFIVDEAVFGRAKKKTSGRAATWGRAGGGSWDGEHDDPGK